MINQSASHKPFKSPFDQAKYNFIKRLSIFTATILFALSIAYFFKHDLFFWPVFSGSICCFITYFIITKTKLIRASGIFANISINIVIAGRIILHPEYHYFEDFYWIICITLFAFYVIGKKWGIGTLAFNILLLIGAFIYVQLQPNGAFYRPTENYDIVYFIINMVIGSIILISVVLELLRQNKIAEEQYSSTHKELEIQHAEKSTMLREIHHRVKNNLQIITSLLRLQAYELNEEREKAIFSESINRISAIAKIHDRMYDSKSLNKIDLKTYLESLVTDLVQSYGNTIHIRADIKASEQAILPKDLVPIALIFNELVTNSVKHAFKDLDTGSIQIQAQSLPEHQLALTYSDNGKWVEPENSRNSLGLELIESFVEQLDGTLSLEKENGTVYHILVKLSNDG